MPSKAENQEEALNKIVTTSLASQLQEEEDGEGGQGEENSPNTAPAVES